MKKLMICLISVLFLISCGKEDMEYAKVRFSYAMQGESMTKTLTSSSIKTLIESTLPSSLSLEIEGLDVNGFTETTTGVEECLAIGTYRVTHTESGSLFSKTPVVLVEDTIEVHSYISSYSVDAHYGCYALVYDASEIEELSYKGDAVEMLTSGDIRLVFVESGEDAIDVTLTPKENTDYEETTFSLCVGDMEGSTKVNNGWFYKMTPKKVAEGEGTLTPVYATWYEGEL